MTSALPRATHQTLQQLFAEGTCAGLTDAQLLERFLASRDGQAFETLVIRHGPMVLTVGRAILGNLDDAEDAFQATFLILARRAGSIRGQAGLGPWLHRVASRVAIEANAQARRRREGERRAGTARARGLRNQETGADLRRAIHEELERLPERWRRPVVLCDLEGKTHAQAAAELHWGEATVRRRLTAARNRLRSRLTRQGIAPPAIGLVAIDPNKAGATVPEAWVATTTRAATGLVAGRGAWLAASVLNRMALATLRTTATAGLAFTFLAWVGMAVLATGPEPVAASVQAPGGEAERPRPPDAQAPAAPPRDADAVAADDDANAETVAIRGRVLGPDGRPREGAKLYLGQHRLSNEGTFPLSSRLRATSGPDGRFRFEVPRRELAATGVDDLADPFLVALAEGTGPAWVPLKPGATDHEQTVTLNKDDVPLTGRVIDPEGRPVVGATVTVYSLTAIPDDDYRPWLQELRANRGRLNPKLKERMGTFLSLDQYALQPTTRTGNDGGFRLEGIGRDRIIGLSVQGPATRRTWKIALTTDDPDYPRARTPVEGAETDLLLGPGLEIVARPGRSIRGTVRDLDTGEPLPGITVEGGLLTSTVTDQRGRYSIIGLSDSGSLYIKAIATSRPYMTMEKFLQAPLGAGTIDADLGLKRGVWIEGQVTDRVTGRAVRADVTYFPTRDNPIRGDELAYLVDTRTTTDTQGRYRLAGHPGRGILAAVARGSSYLKGPPLEPAIKRELKYAIFFPHDTYEAVATIDVPPGPGPFPHDFQLEPGRPQRVMIVGPDGSPVAGATVIGRREGRPNVLTLKGAEFTYVHPRPGEVETLVVTQKAKHLGAVLEVTGNEPGPLRVVLVPTGTVLGRIVDSKGQPRAHVTLVARTRRKSRGTMVGKPSEFVQTTADADGRFRFDDLVPGVEYEVGVGGPSAMLDTNRPVFSPWWTVAPGETKHWGDVQALPRGIERGSTSLRRIQSVLRAMETPTEAASSPRSNQADRNSIEWWRAAAGPHPRLRR